jgi:hypothetical protein
MKTKYSVLIIAGLAMISVSQAQLVFGVKPGLTANSAQFGFSTDGVIVFGGLEYFRVTETVEESGTNQEYNYSNGYPYSNYTSVYYSDKYETSVNIYAPYIGAKIPLGARKDRKIGSYLTAIIGKPLIFGSGSSEQICKNLRAWMLMAGFGAEYFISEDFSIGGEFGLRMLLVNYSEDEASYYSTYKYNLNIGVGITYSTIVLNYYF